MADMVSVSTGGLMKTFDSETILFLARQGAFRRPYFENSHQTSQSSSTGASSRSDENTPNGESVEQRQQTQRVQESEQRQSPSSTRQQTPRDPKPS